MITVIMPVYNEGEWLYRNVCTVHGILCEAKIEHRFLLVDDGSKDNTWEEMVRLSHDYPQVSVLRLSRNFGKEYALCAALENAAGDAVVVMDSDLQHPPEMIPEMVRLWREEGYDVVEGIKANRGKESKIGKFAAVSFYKLFRLATGIDIGAASDFKLLSRQALDAWKKMPERGTFFRGMSAWIGFKRCALPFEVRERFGGKSKWNFRTLLRLAVNSITSYSSAPLFLIFWLGVIMLIAGLILGIQTLINFFIGNAASGFSTVILLLLLIGSGIMISLSIIGLYIAKIFDEVKGRPRYLIREAYGDAILKENHTEH